MLECRSRGHEIAFVIPPGDGRLRRLLDNEGVEVLESRFDFSFRPSIGLPIGLWRLRRQLRQMAPDVVFYHLIASALAVRIATLFMRARRVHMVAGPLYLESPPIRFIERLLVRLDDVLVAGSEHTAVLYRELGMPPSRVIAIPYGTDIRWFEKGPDQREDLFGAEVGDFIAIMVAYVYAPKSSVYPGTGIKGHETLLEAWRLFAANKPDAHLVLVGSGFDSEGEDYRRRLFSKLGVDDHPRIHWFSSVVDVRPFYSSADVSVSPSLSENHGAALEASAMGCPSIVSDAGALPEAVVRGLSGWVVPKADVGALVAALEMAYEARDGTALASMGSAARRHIEIHFDQADCSSRVADVLLGGVR
ncbi:glycosyltransferase [Nocardioides albidus]|nr:glycosyltransferase [Nocardioides albidus]